MKLPISYSGISTEFSVEDVNCDLVYPEEVCDAINNAAAGPWEKGPVPDGKKEGEELLICYEAIEPAEFPCTVTVMWIEGRWIDWRGKTPLMSVEIFAHINTYVAKEATE